MLRIHTVGTFRSTCDSYSPLTYVCQRWIHSRYHLARGAQIFQKSRSYHKIVNARRVTWRKFHTEKSQIFGATIQNLAIIATWCLGVVHPYSRQFRKNESSSICCTLPCGCNLQAWRVNICVKLSALLIGALVTVNCIALSFLGCICRTAFHFPIHFEVST
jgi:hypothetical protein